MNKRLLSLRNLKLPLFFEFVLVLTVALGYFIFSAIKWLTPEESSGGVIDYGNTEIYFLILYEIAVLLIIAIILKWQKRTFKDFGIAVSVDDVTAGLILFVINYLLYLLMFRLFGHFVMQLSPAGETADGVYFSFSVDLVPLIFFSIFNPIFEEFILVGYIVTAIRKQYGLLSCLLLSVGFRLSFHIYQGPIILLSILPMGILFMLYYWHKRRIVPLVIAHGLMDFLSFYAFMIIQEG